MESITLSALLLLLILVTPALLLIFVFRLFYPKTRTMPASDAKTLLICCIINLFINGFLLENYSQELLNSGGIYFFSDKAQPIAKSMIAREASTTTPNRPTEFLSEYFDSFKYPATNLWGLILNLHIRTFIFGLFVFLTFKFVGLIEEVLQAIPFYREDELRWYHRALSKFFGYDFTSTVRAGYEQNKVAIRIFQWEPTRFFREAIYHPWAILTRTNRRREILMADILTTEGSLYSGALSSWVQTDHTVSEIALEYTFRYYPEETNKEENELEKSDSKEISKKIKSRKSVFIKNNGELVIPRERIETLHFWEIRRQFEVGVPIKSLSDLEKLKWYLVLAFVYPRFFARISILVEASKEEWVEIRRALGKWLNQNGIKYRKEDIIVEVVH